MNTLVSAASLASATAIATTGADASTTLPAELIERFLHIRAWYLEKRKQEELWNDEFYGRFHAVTGLSKEQYRAIERDDPRWEAMHAVWRKLYAEFPSENDEEECNRLCDERWDIAEAMMEHKPQTFADLAWQAEAYLIADLELVDSSVAGSTSDWLIRTLFHNIRMLGALPPADDPLGVLSIDLRRDSEAQPDDDQDEQAEEPDHPIAEMPSSHVDDDPVIRARAELVEADNAIDSLIKDPTLNDIDCEDIPGFLEADERRDKAIKDLIETPARSFEGLVVKAAVVAGQRLQGDQSRHGALGASLANDVLKYFEMAA